MPLDGHRLGIGFERHFRIGRDIERLAAGGDQRGDLLRLEQRRRAAAEKDRVGSGAVGCAPDLRVERAARTAPSARHRTARD